jgi:hypothetical protein
MSRRLRVVVAVALTAFLVLAGTGIATAAWNAANSTSGSVSAAAQSMGALGGTAALDDVYLSVADAPAIATLTVTDTGATPLGYALTGTVTGTAALASQVTLSLWSPGAAGCGTAIPASGVSSAALSSPGFTLPAAARSAAPGTTVTVCAATKLAPTAIASLQGAQIVSTLTMTGNVGNWITRSSASFTQSTYKMAEASALTCQQEGWPLPTKATLSWEASPGASGTVSYRIVDASNPAVVIVSAQSARTVTLSYGALTGSSENLLLQSRDSSYGVFSAGIPLSLKQGLTHNGYAVQGLTGNGYSVTCVTPAAS